MGAVSRWLDGFVRDQCARPEDRVQYLIDGQDDRSTLDAMAALLGPLAESVPLARSGVDRIRARRSRCDARGHLRDDERAVLQGLVAAVESALA